MSMPLMVLLELRVRRRSAKTRYLKRINNQRREQMALLSQDGGGARPRPAILPGNLDEVPSYAPLLDARLLTRLVKS